MRILEGRNVCDLLPLGLDLLVHEGVLEQTRDGPALVVPWPVTSVYERPTERVLRSARRDANPFFHLFEALWMLAGRNDAESLSRYVSDFGLRFAEPDGRIHGAYGHRWRYALGHDQLDAVVGKLRVNPQDRQAVIQMWDGRRETKTLSFSGGALDTDCGDNDLLGDWRDRPCNTHVYLRVRNDIKANIHPPPQPRDPRDRELITGHVLDLTVLCRSNDIVWGAYGANAVHFSFLQEYLAGRIGVGVGRMDQMSNNYHGYVDTLDRIGDPVPLMEEPNPYEKRESYNCWTTAPIGVDWEDWDNELRYFMSWHDALWSSSGLAPYLYVSKNTWFVLTAAPLARANYCRVMRNFDKAVMHAQHIDAPDWRGACVEWLERRIK
jgi:thymidylate synthase